MHQLSLNSLAATQEASGRADDAAIACCSPAEVRSREWVDSDVREASYAALVALSDDRGRPHREVDQHEAEAHSVAVVVRVACEAVVASSQAVLQAERCSTSTGVLGRAESRLVVASASLRDDGVRRLLGDLNVLC